MPTVTKTIQINLPSANEDFNSLFSSHPTIQPIMAADSTKAAKYAAYVKNGDYSFITIAFTDKNPEERQQLFQDYGLYLLRALHDNLLNINQYATAVSFLGAVCDFGNDVTFKHLLNPSKDNFSDEFIKAQTLTLSTLSDTKKTALLFGFKKLDPSQQVFISVDDSNINSITRSEEEGQARDYLHQIPLSSQQQSVLSSIGVLHAYLAITAQFCPTFRFRHGASSLDDIANGLLNDPPGRDVELACPFDIKKHKNVHQTELKQSKTLVYAHDLIHMLILSSYPTQIPKMIPELTESVRKITGKKWMRLTWGLNDFAEKNNNMDPNQPGDMQLSTIFGGYVRKTMARHNRCVMNADSFLNPHLLFSIYFLYHNKKFLKKNLLDFKELINILLANLGINNMYEISSAQKRDILHELYNCHYQDLPLIILEKIISFIHPGDNDRNQLESDIPLYGLEIFKMVDFECRDENVHSALRLLQHLNNFIRGYKDSKHHNPDPSKPIAIELSFKILQKICHLKYDADAAKTLTQYVREYNNDLKAVHSNLMKEKEACNQSIDTYNSPLKLTEDTAHKGLINCEKNRLEVIQSNLDKLESLIQIDEGMLYMLTQKLSTKTIAYSNLFSQGSGSKTTSSCPHSDLVPMLKLN